MILVTGGTGTTGSHILKELSRMGRKTRALVRTVSSRLDLPGVEQVQGDLSRPETIPPALEGVESALLLSSPSEEANRLQINFIQAAAKARLPYLVKFSAAGLSLNSPARVLRQHAEIEAAVREAGIPFASLRPGQFMQNLLSQQALIAGQGAFYFPMGDGRVSMVDARDIAVVAARVLADPEHAGQAYEITGPEAITYSRVAGALEKALSRPVKYVDVPPAAFRQNLKMFGLTEWLAGGLIELFEILRNNGLAGVTDVVEKIGGKQPFGIDQFAADYAPAFLGQAAAHP